MKRTLFVIISLITCTVLLAGTVSQEEARQKAMQFLSGKRIQAMQNGSRIFGLPDSVRNASSSPLLLPTTITTGNQPLYMFNVEGDGGFVIMSGDDRTPSVLGYSDQGSINPDSLPVNVKDWLDSYSRQIKALPEGFQAEPTGVKMAISPLLPTRWNQIAPYNLYSPNNSITGCLATAMAQVLYYHAWKTGQPSAIVNPIPGYVTETDSVWVGGIRAGTPIDWQNMLDIYYYKSATPGTAYADNVEAVSKLMLYCGVAVKMDYAENDAAASSYEAPYAFKHYFGYSSSTRLVFRNNYTQQKWNDLVYSELMAQRPLLYSGVSSSAGHAFVVDGSDGEGMFHVNWGWGGRCNGYFRLDVLNPSDKSGAGAGNSEDGYTIDQCILVGAQPGYAGYQDDTPRQLNFCNIETDGNAIVLDAWNRNAEAEALDFFVGVGYIDDFGDITPIDYTRVRQIPKNCGVEKMRFVVPENSKQSYGSYKIVPISREVGDDEWLTSVNPDHTFVSALFGYNGLTLIAYPIVSLKLAGIDYGGKAVAGIIQNLNVTVQNMGDEFYGTLYLFAQSMAVNPILTEFPTVDYAQGVGVTLYERQTLTVQMQMLPLFAGEYNIWITTDEKGTKVVGKGKMYVEEPESENPVPSNVKLDISISVKNIDSTGRQILGNVAMMETTVVNSTNSDYEGVFVPTLMKQKSDGTYASESMDYVVRRFPAHTTTVLENNIDVEPSSKYLTYVYYDYNGFMIGFVGSVYSTAAATIAYLPDGSQLVEQADTNYVVPKGAVAVSFIGNDITANVITNDNPNCLYFLSDNAVVPEGLKMNVVKGSQADSIVISDDGLGFYPIRAFTADHIQYTRKVESFLPGRSAKLEDGSSIWSTITLPFDVKQCMVGGYELPWAEQNYSGSDDGAMLMKFVGDNDGDLHFKNTTTLAANTPYLVSLSEVVGIWRVMDSLMVFTGSNAYINNDTKAVLSGKDYRLVGTTNDTQRLDDVYKIAIDGSFCERATMSVNAFRAYFAANDNVGITPNRVSIVFDGNAPVSNATADVNGDGVVDKKDIDLVKAFIMGKTQAISFEDADVNNDGMVGIADIVAITRVMR